MLGPLTLTEADIGESEFERCFREHYGLVFRTAYRITGSAADAEDVAQTVFLRLARRPVALEQGAFYLRRAAVNAALDVLRGRRTRAQVALSLAGEAAATFPDAALRAQVRAALAQMPPRTAEICSLRFLEGMPNREIARLLKMPVVNVAVAIHRARRHLKRELGGRRQP